MPYLFNPFTGNLDLSGGEAGPQGPAGSVDSVTGTAPIVSTGGTAPVISITEATLTAAGSLSVADKIKLNGIATGATANSADATLLARTNHTGTQDASTITGLALVATSGSATNLTVGTLSAARLPDTTVTAGSYGSSTAVPVLTIDATGRITSASTTTVSGGGGGGGGGTITDVTGTAPIVSSGGTSPAISITPATTSLPGSMSSADKIRLNGIADNATANSPDSTLLSRANHTGTQAVSTITGLGSAALLSLGTTSGTVAAGDDSRITGALSTATAATTYQPLATNLTSLGAQAPSYYLSRANHTGTQAATTITGLKDQIGIACSDETTNLTASTSVAKVTLQMPYAMTLTQVRLNVGTAPTGSALIVNIKQGGTTIFSTRPQIDANAKTSVGSATAAVFATTALTDDAEITIFVEQIGSTIAGSGLKIWLIGTRA